MYKCIYQYIYIFQISPSLPSQITDPNSYVHAKNSSPVELYDCRWLKCDQKFTNMDDLVNHVNDYHVKVERPDVDYQCKWDGCPRKGFVDYIFVWLNLT
jgi:hypothetical protein